MLQGCALIGRELFASWLNPWILNPAATIQREWLHLYIQWDIESSLAVFLLSLSSFSFFSFYSHSYLPTSFVPLLTLFLLLSLLIHSFFFLSIFLLICSDSCLPVIIPSFPSFLLFIHFSSTLFSFLPSFIPSLFPFSYPSILHSSTLFFLSSFINWFTLSFLFLPWLFLPPSLPLFILSFTLLFISSLILPSFFHSFLSLILASFIYSFTFFFLSSFLHLLALSLIPSFLFLSFFLFTFFLPLFLSLFIHSFLPSLIPSCLISFVHLFTLAFYSSIHFPFFLSCYPSPLLPFFMLSLFLSPILPSFLLFICSLLFVYLFSLIFSHLFTLSFSHAPSSLHSLFPSSYVLLPSLVHSFIPLILFSCLRFFIHSLLFCQSQSLSPAYSYPVLKWKYVCVVCGGVGLFMAQWQGHQLSTTHPDLQESSTHSKLLPMTFYCCRDTPPHHHCLKQTHTHNRETHKHAHTAQALCSDLLYINRKAMFRIAFMARGDAGLSG